MRRALLPTICLLLVSSCGGGTTNEGRPALPPPEGLHVRTSALPVGRAGRAYVALIEAAGGTGTGNTWRIVSGTLPSGVVFEGDPACLAWSAWSHVGTIEPDEGTGERTEISGLTASRRNPGVLWAHDDSGGDALLHAVAEDGTLRQRYLLDAAPFDWEDIALGPGPDPDLEYLYVGDIGDNSRARAYVTILRVEEPIVPASEEEPILLPHETYRVTYPDAPRDCEALVVDWTTGTPYLLEKNDTGGDVFRVPLPLDPTWTADDPGTMTAVTTGRPLPGNVTAADAARDGRRLALRTYTLGSELVALDSAGFESAFETPRCSFTVPILGQYESLAWADDGTSLYTTTEFVLGSAVPLHRADAEAADRPARIQGTPDESGTWTIVVEVRDTSGERASRTLSLTIE